MPPRSSKTYYDEDEYHDGYDDYDDDYEEYDGKSYGGAFPIGKACVTPPQSLSEKHTCRPAYSATSPL